MVAASRRKSMYEKPVLALAPASRNHSLGHSQIITPFVALQQSLSPCRRGGIIMSTPMVKVIGPVSRILRTILTDGVQTARQGGQARLVSYCSRFSVVDPLAFFERGQFISRERFYWERATDQIALVGVGAVQVVCLHGPGRFDDAALAWRRLMNDALVLADAPSALAAGPVMVGGFAFEPEDGAGPIWDGFPAGRFTVPRLMLTRQGQESWLTFNALVNGDDDPDALVNLLLQQAERLETSNDNVQIEKLVSSEIVETADARASAWKALVGKTAAAARRGAVEKVVLARAESIIANQVFQPGPVLGRLRAEYPGCTVFAVDRGQACFLGASPERLVQLREGEVSVSCLAGTTGRGKTSVEDAQLGAELLASLKNRVEHAVVVRILRESVGNLCREVTVPDRPVLMKVRNVQHLYTPLSGHLRPDYTLLDVVQRLHPTPAVGGFPRDVALDLIRHAEGLDRGWYAGPVGWIDQRGNGDFAVAIRSALLRGSEAVLFSGCGIVADSDPDAEYEESCLKLQPMRSALRAS